MTAEAFFLIVGFASFGILLVMLLLGDLDLDDIDGETDWFNTKVILSGFAGFGIIGWACESYNLPLGLSWVAAGAAFFAVAALVWYGILKPMMRMQSNSVISRQDYLGLTSRVTLSLSSSKRGEVTFVTKNGFTTEPAYGVADRIYEIGESVIIIDIAEDGVVVTSNPL